MIDRLRTRLGIWLLRPHAVRLLRHYHRLAREHTDPVNREHCEYIFIGIQHVMNHRRRTDT